MARGVRRSLDERITELNVKIEKATKTLNELVAERKELEAQKQAELLSQVEEAAKKKGISVAELLEKIVNSK